MPQVATLEEVFAVARVKRGTKAETVARAQALGLPAPPIVSSVAQATVEYTFVSPAYQPLSPDEVFCVILDETTIVDIDRRHREINIDPRLRGNGSPLPTRTQETPILIARTL